MMIFNIFPSRSCIVLATFTSLIVSKCEVRFQIHFFFLYGYSVVLSLSVVEKSGLYPLANLDNFDKNQLLIYAFLDSLLCPTDVFAHS